MKNWLFAFFLISLAFTFLVPRTHARSMQTHVRLEQPPNENKKQNGWNLLPTELNEKYPSDPHQLLKLTFALKQQNVDKLNRIFEAVSDPRNPRYTQHLTKDEVDALVAPSPKTKKTVLDWIAQKGGKDVEDLGDFITAYFERNVIESELHCKFERFGNPLTNSTILRSRIGYSVPVELAPHLDFIGGIQRFPTLRHSQRITDEPGLGVTPRIVRDRYHVTTYGNNGRNRQAVAQFLDQYYDPLDLQEFFLLFFWEGIGALPTVIGPNYPYLAGVEASLDIEYIMSVGANISTIFYSTPGLHENQEPFLDWAILVSNTSDSAIPYVISVSYGDDEDSLDKAYTDRINNEFQKLGTRGVSIFFASGDDGVGCNTQGTAFVPDYPASSPYVTAVGGTWTDYFFELGPEIVNGLSGGGFSNFYAAPSYQTDAVSYYLAHANNLPAPSFYNRTGRAYPDVSALSFGFVVVINLVPFPGVAGTSCSAPSFAGVISMVNDQRLNAGKKPLGFLNPLIYQHPEVFYDVTEGCNPGGCPNDGFCAAPSWDPASGFGSPLYDKFVQLALSLQ